jgi:hypothetical protein
MTEAEIDRREALGRRMGQQRREPIYLPPETTPWGPILLGLAMAALGFGLLWAITFLGCLL